MLITDKPEPLEERAAVLERGAAELEAGADTGVVSAGKALSLLNALDMRNEAAALRHRAGLLRAKRAEVIKLG
jgi:hypothetical protein